MESGVIGHPATVYTFDECTTVNSQHKKDIKEPVDLEFVYGYKFDANSFNTTVESFSNINSVLFNNIKIEENDLINISQTISKNCPSLLKLKFNRVNMKSFFIGVRYLADTVKTVKSLQELHLTNCCLTDNNVTLIIDCLANNDVLHTLNIDDNRFESRETVNKLASILNNKNSNLTDVSFNELLIIREEVFQELYKIVEKNRKLLYFNLNVNRLYMIKIQFILKSNIKLRDRQIISEMTPEEREEYDLFIKDK